MHHGYCYLCPHYFPDGSLEFKGVVVVHREHVGSADVLLCVWMLRGDLQNNTPAVHLWIQRLENPFLEFSRSVHDQKNVIIDIIAQIFHRKLLGGMLKLVACHKVLVVLALPLWRWVFLGRTRGLASCEVGGTWAEGRCSRLRWPPEVPGLRMENRSR